MPECNECCDTAPVKFGAEDMSFGCGTEEQIRSCKKVTITKINASHIVYCPTGGTVEMYIEQLKRMFPYLECQIGTPLVNYGSWEDAEVSADVSSCAVGLPDTVVQRIPFGEGAITIHNGCVWISLVPDNLSEPSEESQNNQEWLCLTSIDGRIDSLVLRVDALETRVDALEQCCEDANTRITNLEVGDVLRVLRVDNRLFMTSDGSEPVAIAP